jgi:hypothetical protein
MASNGTYGVVYCGADGLGVGVFNVKDGVIVGADYAGGRYHGTPRPKLRTARSRLTSRLRCQRTCRLCRERLLKNYPIHVTSRRRCRLNLATGLPWNSRPVKESSRP